MIDWQDVVAFVIWASAIGLLALAFYRMDWA
jgi:hypothetical protein